MIRSLIAVAGLALSSNALAAATDLIFEASTDHGLNWASSLAAEPGQEVSVRIRVRLVGTETSIGLAGLRHQPTVTGWTPGSQVLPFTINLPYTAAPNAYGRVDPFWAVGMTGTSAVSGQLTTFIDGGNTLRFAGSKATTVTADLTWGLASSQGTLALEPTDYNSSLDVVVFRFGFRAGADASTYTCGEAPGGIPNNRATWYTQHNGLNSLQAAIGSIVTATVTVVPAPSALAVLALGIGVQKRRRGRGSVYRAQGRADAAFDAPREPSDGSG